MADYTDDLRLAHVLADDADSLTEARFKALDLHVMSKPDLTPVTDADEAVEESIRRTLSRVRSRDAVTGEEQGSTGHSQRRWIVDPIDGTKNFVRGVPVWATLIALAVDDEVVLGVVSAPLLQRRWWASTGAGTWTGRSLLKATQCHVSDVRRLEDASLSYSSLRGWDDRGQGDDFISLMRRVWRSRAYGDFWSYMLLAEGAVDIATEPELAVHDMAALDVIVREAGGTFTSLAGEDGPWGGNALATNGHLHDVALSFLGAVAEDDGDPDWQPSGPGSVSELRPRGPRPVDALFSHADSTLTPTRTPPRTRIRVRIPSHERSPVQHPLGSLPSRYHPFRKVAMKIVEVLNAKPQSETERGVVTITPDAGVRELIAKLAEHNVGALIVSSDGETVEGIVSERDVVRHLHHDGTVVNNTVGAIMTEVVETTAPDSTLDDLMEVMTRRRIRHVPVVKDGVLVGIVSIGDVVKHKMSQLEFERDQLDSYVHQT